MESDDNLLNLQICEVDPETTLTFVYSKDSQGRRMDSRPLRISQAIDNDYDIQNENGGS